MSTIVYMSLYQFIHSIRTANPKNSHQHSSTGFPMISPVSLVFGGGTGRPSPVAWLPVKTTVPRLGRPGAARLIRAATASRNTRNRRNGRVYGVRSWGYDQQMHMGIFDIHMFLMFV